MTNDGSDLSVYVNGVLGASIAVGQAFTSGTGHVAIGTILFNNDTSPLDPFKGKIANTSIYNSFIFRWSTSKLQSSKI